MRECVTQGSALLSFVTAGGVDCGRRNLSVMLSRVRITACTVVQAVV